VKKLTKNCNRDNGAKQQPRQNRNQATTIDKTGVKPQMRQYQYQTATETKVVQNHK